MELSIFTIGIIILLVLVPTIILITLFYYKINNIEKKLKKTMKSYKINNLEINKENELETSKTNLDETENIEHFNDENNVQIIQKCIDAGITFKKQNIITDSKLSDKTFVMTGSLSTMKRSQIKNQIEKHNARLSNSISKNTDFLILGENPGSKFEKAKKMNVKIINEKEFLIMLENN